MNAPRTSSGRILSGPLTRIRIAVVAIAAPAWVSGYLSTAAAEPVAPSVRPENVAQPVSKENFTTLFGQSFPAAPGNTPFPEALKSLAPKELLKLGAGSPTRLYIEKITFPGQISGSEEARSYVAGQNLIETRNGIQHNPYYANRVEVHASKNDQGVSVINHMYLKGSFYPDRNEPFKRGSRKEAKEMISALCRVMGRPQIQVRKHPISELRYMSSDALVWNTRNAIIWLYFEKHLLAMTMVSKFAKELLPSLLMASVGVAQENGPTRPERPWPVAVELADVRMTGELSKRLTASFDRLEEEFYSPPALYDSPNAGWPGDKEGRTLLGLVLLEQVTGRPAKHLEASLDLYSRGVNAEGYLGPVMPPDAVHEQTLGGQFWVLNAFYEYEEWKMDGRVNPWAEQILNNIYLASADAYPRYPITPAERKTQSFKLADGRTGKWDLAPMDIGCGMAGSLDALTDAYARHPSKETGRVLDTVIKRWQEIQLEAIHAQLHSTLISTRSLLRHFETTGRKELLQVATDRYRLYREKAMSENFENHNWFGRPEWTEGCAVVDSFIIAVQLWRYTGEATYLEDAHRIYYNGLSVNQRSNGGLGCNSCPSSDNPFLTVISQEATQCCTMRGADGLTKAAQYCFFRSEAGVILPFYQDAQATLRWGEQSLTLRETTGYPWEGDMRLEVTAAQGDEPRTLSLFTPSWAERPVLKLNGRELSVTSQGGFLNISRRWQAGDFVELSFEQSVAAKPPVNRVNGADRGEYRTFHYGPLMLGYAGPKAVTVKSDARFRRRGERDFLVEGTDLVLQPIYHLLDPAVSKNRGYRRQILFP